MLKDALDSFERQLEADDDGALHGEERGGHPDPSRPESEYEEQRQRNIERNQQVLRDLGLEGSGSLRPQKRPATAPRRPRPPPGEPTRASERLQGQPAAPSYSEADADRELDNLLASDEEEERQPPPAAQTDPVPLEAVRE
eukprot:2794305-Prymnesium_polylepis.1